MSGPSRRRFLGTALRLGALPVVAGLGGPVLLGACGDDDDAGDGAGGAEPPSSTAPAGAGASAPVVDLAAGPPCTGTIAVTPRTSDEHYRSGAPERVSLLEPGLAGTRLVLRGYVAFRDCRPVGGAVLDVWHADADGAYDDVGWRLRGVVRADDTGRYVVETIVPGAYEGRAPHVHVKLSEAPGGRIVTTTLFLAGDPRNAADGAWRPELEVPLSAAPDGWEGRFDLVPELG